MNKDERATLRRAVERARRLLEDEVADQLEGAFGILQSGKVLDDAPGDPTVRQRLLELITHHQAGGETAKEAVERATRELAFTSLNRFVALKMAERRGLVRECISKGPLSDGVRELADCAPGLRAALPDGGYRLLLEAVMDEISLGLSALFDRRAPAGLIWPRPKALDELLDILNAAELAGLWEQDETIGWVYQYFNPKEEREAMRKASAAPRNSRELAVRNQFFTPRYVVAFLTDNTLGRIWYEMRKGDTALKESCRYLVRRPSEVFLEPGEPAPPSKDDEADLAQEELLRRPVYIEHRPKKDPRDIKVLDPACGSGHFLLYAFELLERIYEEAWADAESPASEATGRTLREDYGSMDELRRAAPKLIIEHNLHGIDIDPRAVQIAALALWLRAQRAWQGMGLKPIKRPQISRSNIVTAEPMPGEDDMRRELVDSLRPRVLGQLVDLVFERMRLAGEAGSLLKIEEEIKDGIAEARKQWLETSEGEQQLLFPGMGPTRPEQTKLRFDLTGVDNERFWEEAESRILEALKAYSERAENGRAFRRRLFAEDAARGFAFIDVCRRRYDVVLMNPPFGDFSKPYKPYSRTGYPNSYNDILAAFVERWLYRLEYRGRLGAITSRTCFFLASFAKWRENVILDRSALGVVADLGQGVMDAAMVEAAAYILERSPPTGVIPFIRAIAERSREAVVKNTISAINGGTSCPYLLLGRQDTFLKLVGAPFVYWAEPGDLDRFSALPSFEPEAAEVRVGLQTGDDPRFVRAVWEVAPEDTQFVYYPTNGEPCCQLDDPIVVAYFKRRRAGSLRWAFHVKAGASQPWYSPITLKVNWHQDGRQIRNFRDVNGKLRSRPQNMLYYCRPGFSWTRRAARFYPYVIPGNCIPSVSRYMAFPKEGLEYDALGVSASRIASAFMRFYGEKFEWPNFLVDNLKLLPWPTLNQDARYVFRELIEQEVERRRRAYMNHEPFHEFLLPIKVSDFSNGRQSLAFDPKTLLGEEIEHVVSTAYGFDRIAAARIERDVLEALEFQHGAMGPDVDDEADNGQDSDEDTDFVLDYSPRAKSEALLSYCTGCIYGRWDIRIAIDPSLAPKLAAPFDPLPVCPPGMLIGPDALPAKPGGIVSEEWLRSRPDASTLPPRGSVAQPTIEDTQYPLPINWDGTLVDDPGLDGNQPHRDDVVRRCQEVLDLIWKDKAHEIEQEACEMLCVSTLRDYFRKPSGFFDDHLKRYSKSRRKAPIYWPLSTASGAYTVWVYYHRLTEDTLYRAVSDYVSPKISQVEDRITQREAEHRSAQGRDAARLAKELSELTSLLQELKELRDELLRVAHLPYRPNLNDGVQITAAPLWRLFRLPRWRSELECTWQALERGDYDWAHLAYAIWPERVRETCRRDRSIAIAHGLEELYEERSAPQRHARRRRGQAG